MTVTENGTPDPFNHSTPATTPADGVTDEQLDAALDAFNVFPCPMNGSVVRFPHPDQMRAAIAAALATPSPGKAPSELIAEIEAEPGGKERIAAARERVRSLLASPGKADAERLINDYIGGLLANDLEKVKLATRAMTDFYMSATIQQEQKKL